MKEKIENVSFCFFFDRSRRRRRWRRVDHATSFSHVTNWIRRIIEKAKTKSKFRRPQRTFIVVGQTSSVEMSISLLDLFVNLYWFHFLSYWYFLTEHSYRNRPCVLLMHVWKQTIQQNLIPFSCVLSFLFFSFLQLIFLVLRLRQYICVCVCLELNESDISGLTLDFISDKNVEFGEKIFEQKKIEFRLRRWSVLEFDAWKFDTTLSAIRKARWTIEKCDPEKNDKREEKQNGAATVRFQQIRQTSYFPQISLSRLGLSREKRDKTVGTIFLSERTNFRVSSFRKTLHKLSKIFFSTVWSKLVWLKVVQRQIIIVADEPIEVLDEEKLKEMLNIRFDRFLGVSAFTQVISLTVRSKSTDSW